MADSTTVAQLVEYYTNLLIIQYNLKTKARATVALFAEILLANAIFLDVQNAYNITGDSPAVGVQLDVIGKYVGIDRFFTQLVLEDYSALVNYSEASGLPSSPPAFGVTLYSTYGDYNYNGTITYSDLIVNNNQQLNDEAFLILIKLAIIQNNMNYSSGSIDAALYEFFGTDLRAEYPSAMHMIFFITANLTPVLQALVSKHLLPIPIAVGAAIISGIPAENLDFALTIYAEAAEDIYSAFGYGYSTYADYATLDGQTLLYNQISQAN